MLDSGIIFLLYDNRSGSTMLSKLLNSLEGVEVSHEVQFPDYILGYPGTISSEQHIEEILDKLKDDTDFTSYDLNIDDFKRRTIELCKRTDRENLFKASIHAFIELTTQGGTSKFVVKAPGLYYHLDKITESMPSAGLIEIVRDGRAVFASKKSSINVSGKMMEVSVVNAAINWKRKLKLSQPYGSIVRLKYEDIIVNGENWLFEFLENSTLNFSKRKSVDSSEYMNKVLDTQKHLHKNVGRALDTNRMDAWKTDLEQNEIWLYNRIANSQLERLGYQMNTLENRLTLARAGYALRSIIHFIFLKTQRMVVYSLKISKLRRKLKQQFN